MLEFERLQSRTCVCPHKSGRGPPVMHELASLQHDLTSPGRGINSIAQQGCKQCSDVSRVGEDGEWMPGFQDQSAIPGVGFLLETADEFSGHLLQIEPDGNGLGGAGEQHQVADHVPDPECLGSDCHERLGAIGIAFSGEQLLDIARDGCNRVVDFMPRSGGELGQCPQFVIGRQ